MVTGLYYRIGLLVLWLVEGGHRHYIDSVCLNKGVESLAKERLKRQRNVTLNLVLRIQMNC